jgi:divalent metal cation (Fe/Co/Zn/Cd) transporter
VRRALPGSDVVVHVEPGTAGADVRERASAAALTVRGVREVHNVRTTAIDGRLELSLHLKLPADLDLGAAHEIACAVEAAIHEAVPEVVDVHTHIEPLSTGAAAAGAEPTRREVAEEEAVVRSLVADLTGAPAEDVRFRAGDDGLVVLLTVRLEGAQTLDQAHDVASELERRIRERAPTIDEVIVHTEPAGAAPSPRAAGA